MTHALPSNAPGAASGDAAPRAPYVLVVCSPHSTTTFELATGRAYVVGRGAGSDIVLDYPWVGEEHAIVYGGDPPEVVDLGTATGTTLGARRLSPHARHSLGHESILAIGAVSLLVRRAQPVSTVRPRRLPPTSVVPESEPSQTVRFSMSSGHELVTRDPRMRELFELLRQVAASDVSVLVLGETGVGKEVIARAVHECSPRKDRRLVTLNCAAIPENLLESELFGYERGAFSGATSAKPGLFEVANGGTLFLDELGELPRSLQPKLLRVLETGEVHRIGALAANRVDVRIVAATNRNILADTISGAFRADLYYRLHGMTLTIPPLRERPEDVPVLAEFFARRVLRGADVTFSTAALLALREYPWPGNVRELRTVVERALLLAKGEPIATRHLVFDTPPPPRQTSQLPPPLAAPSRHGSQLPPPLAASPRKTTRPPPEGPTAFGAHESPTGVVAAELKAELAKREQRRIREALARAGGNQTDAAKLLGMSRRTLINRLERYGIERPRKRTVAPDDE